MNKTLIAALIAALGTGSSHAIEIITPQELQTSVIQIIDPDRHIKTLGEVAFVVDLAASHDDLLALNVRRSDLKLKDGRSFSAFGVHKKAGIIIIGSGEISHISIASVEGQEARVLFYGKGSQIISPKPEDLAVFDTDFNPLILKYTPLKTPESLDIPVTIALDTSGSMGGHMNTVAGATQEFMRGLPDFTNCRLLTFGTNVVPLSTYPSNCPSAAYLLNTPPKAGGTTALFEAIETGFSHAAKKQSFPNIVVTVTDGMNTVNYKGTLASLKALKKSSNSKLFVFWAGSYDPAHLQGLADYELVSTQNLSSELESFFRSLGVSLSGLQTLHISK
jgi:hypothetical protein